MTTIIFYADTGSATDPPLLNVTEINLNNIFFHYEDFVVDEDMVVVTWTYGPDVCSTLFELQGFTLAKIETEYLEVTEPDAVFREDNSLTAEIPSVNYTTFDGDAVNYRLVALNRYNFTVCSQSRFTFYRFDGMHKLNKMWLPQGAMLYLSMVFYHYVVMNNYNVPRSISTIISLNKSRIISCAHDSA